MGDQTILRVWSEMSADEVLAVFGDLARDALRAVTRCAVQGRRHDELAFPQHEAKGIFAELAAQRYDEPRR